MLLKKNRVHALNLMNMTGVNSGYLSSVDVSTCCFLSSLSSFLSVMIFVINLQNKYHSDKIGFFTPIYRYFSKIKIQCFNLKI